MGPLYNLIENGGKTETEPHVALGWTLLIAGSTCVLSLLCALILGFMDKRAEVLLKKGSSIGGEDVVKLSDILEFPLSFWLLSVVCLAYYVAIFPFISLGQGGGSIMRSPQGSPQGDYLVVVKFVIHSGVSVIRDVL